MRYQNLILAAMAFLLIETAVLCFWSIRLKEITLMLDPGPTETTIAKKKW